MSNINDQFLSKSAYARYIGVDEKAIRKAIEEGKIVRGYDTVRKKINVKEADKEYGFLHKNPRAKAGVSKAKRAEKISANMSALSPKKKDVKSEKSTSPKSDKLNSDKSEKQEEENEESLTDLDYETLLLKIPVHDKLDYKETVRRREILQLALDKKKLEELEGVLVRKAEVDRILFKVGSQLKKALYSMPARCIDGILSADSKVEALNILNQELNDVLTSFADFENIDTNPKGKI